MMGIAQDVYEGDHENLNSLSRYLFNNVDCRSVWGKARGGKETHGSISERQEIQD